ncbi:MAG: cytochrome P450 [Trueperaceae bacterium]
MNLAGGDVRAALDACQAVHGDAFVFGFGPIRYHWFLGLEGMRFVLLDEADAFGNAGAYGFLQPIGGPTALIATDDPEHLRRRRSVQPAFHPRQVDGWADAAAARFERFVAERIADGGGPLLPALRPVVLEIVLDVLLGPSARRRHPRLADDVAAMMAFANQPLLAQTIKLPVPPAPWAGFVAARRRADAAIRADIRARRAGAALEGGAALGEGGVLELLLALDGDPDARLTEDELRDQSLSLVSAGFDTTTAAIAWLSLLLTRGELRDPVAHELADAEPAAAVRAPLANALLHESLRLYPPAPAILRRVRRRVAWRGHALAAGAGVGLSLWHLHRDPRLWREPERVVPQRWLDRGGPWGAPRDPLAYLPFGHGGRYCIGAGLARTLTLAYAWAALRSARWTTPDPDVPPVGMTLVPAGGLPLAWRRG